MSGPVEVVPGLSDDGDDGDRGGDGNHGSSYGSPGAVMPPPTDPMAVARALLNDHRSLQSWRGGWMNWRGPCWAETEAAEIRSRVYRVLEHAVYMQGEEPVPWVPNRRKIADVMEALTAVTHLPEAVSPPAWMNGDGPVPAWEVVSCANGLLHVGSREVYPHTSRFFNMVAVPFGYDPDAAEPKRWLEFLAELWPDDGEAIAALQEWFGYVLSGRTDLQKILLVVGPRRGGKGTIARVLAALVGAANVAGPTLASLGTNFGLSPLIGRPLAIVSDARLGGADTRQVVERLLSISGEDRITIDRKYREPWTGTLPTRFVIMSNELPAFGDAAGAIATRFITLMLTESWLGREDTWLAGHLMAELPGILNWSLDGLDRLSRTGRITEPESSADAVIALADLVSPVSAFVRDCCDRRGEVPVDQLYRLYRAWCEDNGHKPSSKQRLGKDLRAVVPSLRVVRPRDGDDRERRYVGLSLRVGSTVSGTRTYADQEAESRVVRAGPRPGHSGLNSAEDDETADNDEFPF